jgi:hypothetical protein
MDVLVLVTDIVIFPCAYSNLSIIFSYSKLEVADPAYLNKQINYYDGQRVK